MRTIVVTGSASGLGAALVRRLEGDGHRVIGLDRREAPIVADLGTPDGRATGIAEAREACGGSLDGLVSCAGLGPYDDPQTICRVNYFGAVAILDGLKAELSRGQPQPMARGNVVREHGYKVRCMRWGRIGRFFKVRWLDLVRVGSNPSHIG